MDISKLKEYLIDYSTAQNRINAIILKPKLLCISNTEAKFECKGNDNNVYKIEIGVDLGNIYTSSDFNNKSQGICKHTIAAINMLIAGLTDGSIMVLDGGSSDKKSKLQGNQLYLANNVIDIQQIENENKNRYYSSNIVEIESIDKYQIVTKTSSWNSLQQTFTYNPTTQILTIKCSSTKKLQISTDANNALMRIVAIFGPDYFQPDYFENKMKQYLAQYGMTTDDDYEKVFTFELTTKGFKAHTKYKNIQNSAIDLFSVYKNEEVETAAILPYNHNLPSEYGLGFCFEMDKKESYDIHPIQAKYNKLKSDFASSFVIIDNNNLLSGLRSFSLQEEQDLVVKSIQINDNLRLYRTKATIYNLTRSFQYFNENIVNYQAKLLYRYNNSESLTRKNLLPILIKDLPVKLFFTLTESEFFYTLKAKISIGENDYNINAAKLIIAPIFIFCEDVVYPLPNVDTSIHIDYFRKTPEINYFKNNFDDVFDKTIIPLSKKFEIQSSIFKKNKVKHQEDGLERHVYITDYQGEFIVFKPAVQYQGQLISLASQEMLIESINKSADKKSITIKDRNASFEDAFTEDFRKLHLAFASQEGNYFLTPEQLTENYWLLHATEKMQQMGMQVFGANSLKSFKFNVNKAVISVALKSDIDWFDLEIDISFGKQKVGMKELQKAFIKKSNYVALDDGTLGILPEEWMKKFANYFKVGDVKKNSVQLSNYQFGIIDELFEELEKKPPFLVQLLEKKKRLQNIEAIEAVPVPKGIKAKLRDYQHHGLNWLAFLDKYQLGGCLADDMGLGKTLQAITFLQYLKLKDKKCLPSLIIAPTSLIFNWKNEIEKFCPTLKMLAFVGANRSENKDQFLDYDIIISTYGSLLNDVEFIKDFKFNYIILDESQAIKNPNSKRYKAVRLLNSYNRLVLTGTPIENKSFDLYAQMNFINPGLLGNMTHFKKEFSDAIDKENDYDTSNLLGKMIAPFLLRRTKEQVAKELPEKTESIIFCEMETAQRKIYDTFKNKYRDYLLNKIDENGVENSQMYILEGLTKLRQICNSTALINDEEDYGNHSVKLDILMENIIDKTGNHKILVFSQFVKMLQLIKTRLEDSHINYEYLDGQTVNREEKVNNFQNNANVRVFLISLKAGGTGLNLTEADYVFLVDPWWNPAVENQAIDRCYRIGQKQKVMAYRMICKDTIEEKIAQLQGKKKAVASSIITIDEDKKSFDINMVKEFFS